MSLTRVLIAGLATTMLSSTAFANDYYRCNDRYCFDDQADETRELNLRQLDNPGAGMDAVPPPGYAPGYSSEGQGGPYQEAPDQGDNYGPGPDDQDNYDSSGDPNDQGNYDAPDDDDPGNYDSPDDNDDQNGPPDNDQYPDDDR